MQSQNNGNPFRQSMVRNLFSKCGNVHSVTTPNPLRTYAFVYFIQIEDTKEAVTGFRGSVLHGNEIHIDFAKPDQKPQSAGNGASQGTSEVKDDNNQRYLSTLQLAANLLLQIQKKQQQSSRAGV